MRSSRWGRTRRSSVASCVAAPCTRSWAAKSGTRRVSVPARRPGGDGRRKNGDGGPSDQLHLYSSGPYSYAPMSRAAVLGLEDGSAWWGEAFGDASAAWGEVVFNTAMTGYQEIASDASYNGQIVVLTYPLIGNYGTFERASESRRPWVEALVVRELETTCREDTIDLDAYLRSYGVPGLAGIDTRALVRRLRAKGTLRGVILQVPPHRSQTEDIAREAVATARSIQPLAAKPLVVESTGLERQVGSGPKVALLD